MPTPVPGFKPNSLVLRIQHTKREPVVVHLLRDVFAVDVLVGSVVQLDPTQGVYLMGSREDTLIKVRTVGETPNLLN